MTLTSVGENEREEVYARPGQARYGGAATGNCIAGRPGKYRTGETIIALLCRCVRTLDHRNVGKLRLREITLRGNSEGVAAIIDEV